MPSIEDSTPPHTTPIRPCTPVVSLRPQLSETIGSVPMERMGPQVWAYAQDPFAAAAHSIENRAVSRPYALRPPTTPIRPVPRAEPPWVNVPTPRGNDDGLPYAYSHALRRGLNNMTPESPTPRARTRGDCFVAFDRLPVLAFSQEAWAESCCAIMKEPMAELVEPVAVPVFEAVHVFEYVHLKTWLVDSGNICREPMQFKNPVNTVWTPLQALCQVRLDHQALEAQDINPARSEHGGR